MKKLSSTFTAFVKRDFFVLVFLVLLGLTYVFIKNDFFIAVPLLAIFWIALPIRYFIVRKRVVDFYVDYSGKEIILDDLVGHKFTYQFADLEEVKYKRSNRIKVFFKDGKSFSFFTKDLWLAELTTDEEFKLNIRDEMRKIQMLKYQT